VSFVATGSRAPRPWTDTRDAVTPRSDR
jgi:hypothetical protein